MKKLGIAFGLAAASSALFFGCGDIPGNEITFPDPGVFGEGGATGGGLDTSLVPGARTGDSCEADDDCRAFLACTDDVCAPTGESQTGEGCFNGADCADGHCAPNPSPTGLTDFAICVPPGEGGEGEACSTDLECEAGLRCGLAGFSTECVAAGEGGLDATCTLQTDCAQGLFCNPNAEGELACGAPVEPYGVALWEGVTCDEPNDAEVEALFFVPGATGTPDDADFFSLPFPNDVRLTEAGRPDLSGFPTPGPGVIGVDMVEAYVNAIEAKSEGWSASPTLYFRFTGEIDLDSLKAPADGPRRLVVMDVDDLPEDPESGMNTFGTQYSTGGRTKYVCDDWLAIRLPSRTLKPNHRYVAWLTTDIRSEVGAAIERPEQMNAMLGDSAPGTDAQLDAAWNAYAPLREVLDFYEGSSNAIDPDSLLTALSFTVGDPNAEMRALAASTEAATLPAARDWVKCGGGAESPCAQAEGNRACGDGDAAYDEYQALLSVPIFQEGNAPYLSEGGGIAAAPERTEDVCVSVTVPTSAAPNAGFPLVIYGHGTGGNYRGNVRGSVAGNLATGTTPMATLGFDQVQHGPRRGTGEGSEQDPENLFFNFLNPEAARGNPLQGAADLLSVIRYAKGPLAAGVDTGDGTIQVDASKVLVFGHSQGSTHASMALPFSDVSGGVLSGNGGGLAESLLHKTNPVNIAGAIPLVIQDLDSSGGLRMGNMHPVLGLLQHYIDPADPVNFAAMLAERPEAASGVKSVFQTFGLDDTYAPPATLARYVHAAEGMQLAPHPSGVAPSGENVLNFSPEDAAVGNNVGADPETPTNSLVCRQYDAADGSDGHFVVHDVSEANADAIGFLTSLADGTEPNVPAQ